MPPSDPVFVTETGKRLTPRPPRKNPRDPNCALHLRRICGVCTHFPDGKGLRAAPHPCAVFSIMVAGVNDAARCERWTRKIAPAPSIQSDNQNKG